MAPKSDGLPGVRVCDVPVPSILSKTLVMPSLVIYQLVYHSLKTKNQKKRKIKSNCPGNSFLFVSNAESQQYSRIILLWKDEKLTALSLSGQCLSVRDHSRVIKHSTDYLTYPLAHWPQSSTIHIIQPIDHRMLFKALVLHLCIQWKIPK